MWCMIICDMITTVERSAEQIQKSKVLLCHTAVHAWKALFAVWSVEEDEDAIWIKKHILVFNTVKG